MRKAIEVAFYVFKANSGNEQNIRIPSHRHSNT